MFTKTELAQSNPLTSPNRYQAIEQIKLRITQKK